VGGRIPRTRIPACCRQVKGFLDSSVIVRYLVEDHPALTRRAAGIIDGTRELLVTDAVIAEAAWVLTKVYLIPREAVVDELVSLLQKENVRTWGMDKGEAVQALLLCRPSGRVSFADAMVWAAARSAGAPLVYSFDERFPSGGMEVRGEAWAWAGSSDGGRCSRSRRSSSPATSTG